MRTRCSRNKDTYLQARLIAELDESALVENYHAIRKIARAQRILPMIKANAYGHDSEWAGRVLVRLPALYGFGVASIEEGARLREGLGWKHAGTRIVVFSGGAPWTDEKGGLCERHGLVPVIATYPDWKNFISGKWAKKLRYELKFNTGMNRLGIGIENLSCIRNAIKAMRPTQRPGGILSHLAVAEKPDFPLSIMQREKFGLIRRELEAVCPDAVFHLANSAAIWHRKRWLLDDLTDVVRPGLSLYGITPWHGADPRGIRPVMTVKAHVAAVHRLLPGESVGYGATFTVPANARRRVSVAILSAGYADGIHRILSNAGIARIAGKKVRFLGRVAMDMLAVECPPGTKEGDWAELMGPGLDIWQQADAAKTLPYELLTSVSGRVQRVYV